MNFVFFYHCKILLYYLLNRKLIGNLKIEIFQSDKFDEILILFLFLFEFFDRFRFEAFQNKKIQNHQKKYNLILIEKNERNLNFRAYLNTFFYSIFVVFCIYFNFEYFMNPEMNNYQMSNFTEIYSIYFSKIILNLFFVGKIFFKSKKTNFIRNICFLYMLYFFMIICYYLFISHYESFQITSYIEIFLLNLCLLVFLILIKPHKLIVNGGIISFLIMSKSFVQYDYSIGKIKNRISFIFKKIKISDSLKFEFKKDIERTMLKYMNSNDWNFDIFSHKLLNPVQNILIFLSYQVKKFDYKDIVEFIFKSALLFILIIVLYMKDNFDKINLIVSFILFAIFFVLKIFFLTVKFRKIMNVPLNIFKILLNIFMLISLSDLFKTKFIFAFFSPYLFSFKLSSFKFFVTHRIILVFMLFLINWRFLFDSELKMLSIIQLALFYLMESICYYFFWNSSKLNLIANFSAKNKSTYLVKSLKHLLPDFIVDKLLESIKNNIKHSKSRIEKNFNKKKNSFSPESEQKSFNKFGQMKFLADDAGRVNILFASICSLDIRNKDKLELLDKVFCEFDDICKKNGIQKIETVGTIYMACSGLYLFEQKLSTEMIKTSTYERLFEVALQMFDSINKFNENENENDRINIKIGIHSGNCIYGFFGDHKPQFSLIGDTVNTSSRHCSVSSPGQIILSNEFFQRFSNSRKIIFKVKKAIFNLNKSE